MSYNLPDGCTDADTEIGGKLSSSFCEYKLAAKADIYVKVIAESLEEAVKKARESGEWIIDEIDTDSIEEIHDHIPRINYEAKKSLFDVIYKNTNGLTVVYEKPIEAFNKSHAKSKLLDIERFSGEKWIKRIITAIEKED